MGKEEKLKKLKQKALQDKTLPLQKGATNLVFGSGNAETEILFIGEAPGYWEDQKGIPFVGNAGALLNQMLSLIGIEREKVFVTNMIMYRPPENRDPTDEEMEAFQIYVDNIIKIIAPKVIVTLGRFSMAKFLPGVFISGVHGSAHEVNWQGREIKVVPMYHPAAALRNGDIKQKLKNDFLKLKETLDAKPTQEKEKDNTMAETKQMSLLN